MPYRSFGRRRRYGRRRPRRANAGRAVPRTTLAPRHQYLKLKSSFVIEAQAPAATVRQVGFQLGLDSPPDCVRQLFRTQLKSGEDTALPRGWTEYGNIFDQYVVHGCKLRISVSRSVASTAVQDTSIGFAARAQSNNVDATTYQSSLASLPMGGRVFKPNDRAVVIKRYYNMSRIQGRAVTKFNDYFKQWSDATATSWFSLVTTQQLDTYNDYWYFNIDIVWYVSATAVKVETGVAAATVDLLANRADVSQLGEPETPLAADHQRGVNTGVVMHKQNLGLKRVYQ